MRLPALAVHRPVFTTMVTLVVILVGLIALWRLPVDLMPDISYPTLSVSTTYEDASPEEIEELVTRPLEEALSSVPGVKEIGSSSSEGRSSVTLQFNWGTNLDAAANDVRDRLDRVIPRLPDDAERPVLRKFDISSFPIMMLGASSDHLTLDVQDCATPPVLGGIVRFTLDYGAMLALTTSAYVEKVYA